MFDVNVGLNLTNMLNTTLDPSKIDLSNQNLMGVADINSDMYGDIITLDKSRKNILFHIFDPVSSNFTQKFTLTPEDCINVKNVAIGRSL
jgi:hypothetical protein